MIDYITKKTTDIFLYYEIIQNNKVETFQYCFETVFMLLCFIVCTLPVALLFKVFFPSILFLTVFFSLRSVAGGYHTNTPEQCLLLSIFSFYIFLLIAHIYTVNFFTIIIILLIDALILWKAPVEAKNYSLNPRKKRRHKIQCIILILLFTVIYFFLLFYNATAWLASIFAAILFTGIAVLITK